MKNLHRLAIATTAATFLLLLIGGLVHATGAGLACGRVWPSCDGTWFPAMTGGVEFEHTHRLVAGAVGLLTLALAIGSWVARANWKLRGATAAAVLLVFVQAMLGRKTVLEGLPHWVSATHLATAMTFFSVSIWLMIRTRPDDTERVRTPTGWVGVAVWSAAVLVFAQIVLGAAVRHMSAGLVCAAFPMCNSAWWGVDGLQHLHMAHRFGAVIAGLAAIAASVVAWRRASDLSTAAMLGRIVPGLVVIQIVLGLASVFTQLAPWVVTAHLGVGAAILGSLVSLGIILGEAPHPATEGLLVSGEAPEAA